MDREAEPRLGDRELPASSLHQTGCDTVAAAADGAREAGAPANETHCTHRKPYTHTHSHMHRNEMWQDFI